MRYFITRKLAYRSSTFPNWYVLETGVYGKLLMQLPFGYNLFKRV